MRRRLLWPGLVLLLVAAIIAVNVVLVVVAMRGDDRATPPRPAAVLDGEAVP